MSSGLLLGARSAGDEVPEWDLNQVQRKYLARVKEKLASGKYRTESVTNCLCGGSTFQEICAKDRFGLPFGNRICQSCGLIQCNPRLSGENLPEFYDVDYHGLVFGSENIVEYEHMVSKDQAIQIYKFLKDHLTPTRTYSIAEIGAGVGSNLVQIVENARIDGIQVEVAGCEYSHACVEYAKEKNNLSLTQGGVGDLLEGGKKFDVVILSHVLEHFSDPIAEMNRVRGLLATDGIIYVEVPGVFDLHNKPVYRCDYLRYNVVAHIYNFCLGTLTNTLGLAGFNLVVGTEFVRSIFVDSGSKKKDLLNYFSKSIEYISTVDHQKRLFYEFNLTKGDLTKSLIAIATARKVAEEGQKKLQAAVDALNLQVGVQKDPQSSLGQVVGAIAAAVKSIPDLKDSSEKLSSRIEAAEQTRKESIADLRGELSGLLKGAQLLVTQLNSRNDSLQSDLTQAQSKINELQSAIDRKEAERNRSMALEESMRNSLAGVHKELEFLHLEHARIKAEKHKNDLELRNQLQKVQAASNLDVQKSRDMIEEYKRKYETAARNLSVLVNSISWKLTFPVRKIKEIIFPGWKG